MRNNIKSLKYRPGHYPSLRALHNKKCKLPKPLFSPSFLVPTVAGFQIPRVRKLRKLGLFCRSADDKLTGMELLTDAILTKAVHENYTQIILISGRKSWATRLLKDLISSVGTGMQAEQEVEVGEEGEKEEKEKKKGEGEEEEEGAELVSEPGKAEEEE